MATAQTRPWKLLKRIARAKTRVAGAVLEAAGYGLARPRTLDKSRQLVADESVPPHLGVDGEKYPPLRL